MITEEISIVIVESQPIMRAALSTTFASEGISVLAVLSANSDALRTSSNLNPDVVLLAIGTPGWRELEMIPGLREQMPDCAIVAFVTGELPGQENTASKMGANLVLSKATSRSELLKAVREMLRNRLSTASV